MYVCGIPHEDITIWFLKMGICLKRKMMWLSLWFVIRSWIFLICV